MKRREFLHTSAIAGASASILPSSLYAAPDPVGPKIPVYRPNVERWSDDNCTLTWIGHSTVYLNMRGLKILTDPVLFDRVGLYILGLTIGLSRFVPPALPFDDIPKPDLVLLSHAHMDHLDYQSLRALTNKYPGEIDCVMAAHTMDVVRELQWRSLQEIDWWQNKTVGQSGKTVGITAVPVKHFGWRFPGEKDRAKGFRSGRSFNAYCVEREGQRIVFGGDTAMTTSFAELGKRLNGGLVDVAIMPVGAYNPWISVHCNPEQAVQMATDMNARYFVPIHTNTLPHGREPVGEAIERTRTAVRAATSMGLAVDTIGRSFVLPI